MEEFGDFSLVLPVYHGDEFEFFEECFESILRNSLQPAEVIVVFDGEVDSEIENYLLSICENIDRILIKRLPKNEGLPTALNYAIDESRFGVICRMDADDICEDDRFLRQWTEFTTKCYDLLGTGVTEFVTQPDEPGNVRKYPTSRSKILRYLNFRNAFAHPTVMFQKNIFYEAGAYSTHDKYFEDWGLWLRMSHLTSAIGNLQQPLVRMRANMSQIQRRRGIDYIYHEWNFFLRYYKSGHLKFISLLYLIFIRTPIRLAPRDLLNFLYKKFR